MHYASDMDIPAQGVMGALHNACSSGGASSNHNAFGRYLSYIEPRRWKCSFILVRAFRCVRRSAFCFVHSCSNIAFEAKSICDECIWILGGAICAEYSITDDIRISSGGLGKHVPVRIDYNSPVHPHFTACICNHHMI
jgi:hypothetical protein